MNGEIHNPEDLDAPGEGYRFLLVGEMRAPGDEYYEDGEGWSRTIEVNMELTEDNPFTYRRKLDAAEVAVSPDGVPIAS